MTSYSEIKERVVECLGDVDYRFTTNRYDEEMEVINYGVCTYDKHLHTFESIEEAVKYGMGEEYLAIIGVMTSAYRKYLPIAYIHPDKTKKQPINKCRMSNL